VRTAGDRCVVVLVDDGGPPLPIDKALRMLKRQVQNSGHLQALRARERGVSTPGRRRLKARRAATRRAKRARVIAAAAERGALGARVAAQEPR
jgi:ribosomal protein S21